MSHLSSFPPSTHHYTPFFLMPTAGEYQFVQFNIPVGKSLITLCYSLSGPDGEELTQQQPFKEFYFYVKLPSFSKTSISGSYYQHDLETMSRLSWKELKAEVIGICIEKEYKGDGVFY